MPRNYDFSGWATKNDIKCTDGRIIRRGAFKHNNGKQVPLVWNHGHNNPENVLGHAVLYNRDDGVYAYGVFNDTPSAEHARELVKNGDINSLSIWANHLVQKDSSQGRNVLHGDIKEVSLVLSGANEGAVIDSVMMHGDGTSPDDFYESDTEAYIYMYEPLTLYHSDDFDELEDEDIEYIEVNEEDPDLEEDMYEEYDEYDDFEHADDDVEDGETIEDVFNTLSEKQKNAVYAIIGEALNNDDGGELEQSDDFYDMEDEYMKHNIFDGDEEYGATELTHSDMNQILSEAIDDVGSFGGSLAQSFMAHADDYGIKDIEMLFPEYRNLNNPPEFIKREQDWVSGVINGTKHTPFTRVRSMFADITEDEARARGYIKGDKKVDEVFTLLRRTTDPQTIYKRQRLDRDDIIDITDFDVVQWIRAEMRMMLDEEIARAILIGDGRETSDRQKIQEAHIRPIVNDNEMYTVPVNVVVESGASDDKKAKATIRAIIKSRKNYKGSGNPTFFTTEDVLTDMLLLEDGIGHPLYDTEEKLRTALRVSKIVTVPVMEGFKLNGLPLIGIIVNLQDYNVGADKGGEINTFDDFDIDYNQYKYLIETRISGALVVPFSAMAVTLDEGGEDDTKTYTYTKVANPTGSPLDNNYYIRVAKKFIKDNATKVDEYQTYYTRSESGSSEPDTEPNG